jgi:hypothetical protein
MNRAIVLVAALLAPLAWAQSAPPPPSIGTAPEAPAAETTPAAAPQPPAAERQGRFADLLETHVEQVRRGNRVTEVRVTGADGAPRYTMENRDNRASPTVDGQRPGLSAPNFLNIEF